LKLLQRSLGITFVFVTHAQSEALALSDRIVVMNQGRIEQVSPPYELYTRPKSLFVAQFIGRNTLIPGTVRASDGASVTVDTPYGALMGSSRGGVAAGNTANLVLPAEAIDLLSAKTPMAEITQVYGTCAIPVTVGRIQQIGHIVQMDVRLSKGRTVGLEGHADKYGGRFAAGDAAIIAWKKDGATVIAD
jgi:ABC-type Fe3+/spermidine/putrescine transport system ATPase subunit